jgi:rubrerythrin
MMGGTVVTNQQPDALNDLARLVAMAERFSSEGKMNINKLVEATVYSKVRRIGWRYQPAVTADTMQSELDASLRTLKQENLSPKLIVALEIASKALAEHRQDDLLTHEAPDVFVCRTCGYVALASPPERCLDCGAWPGRFRKFVAFFNGDNLEPTDPMEILALLAHNAESLSALVGGLSEAVTSRKPAADVWSIHEHVAHFYDTQELLDTRIDLMVNHENPDLVAIPVYELATKSERHPTSTQEVLAAFRDKRAKCIARLEALPLKDLWRTAQHPEFGRLTILRQTAYMANHEQTHFPDIEALCKQVDDKS